MSSLFLQTDSIRGHKLRHHNAYYIQQVRKHIIGIRSMNNIIGDRQMTRTVTDSRDSERDEGMTACLVHKEKQLIVISCKPITNLLISIRIHMKHLSLMITTIIQVYATTSVSGEEHNEILSKLVQSDTKQIITHWCCMVADRNAKMGQTPTQTGKE